MRKRKKNHRSLNRHKFCTKFSPTSKSLSKHFRLSHAVFPSPLVHHRGPTHHPSSCQTPFHDFTGLEGLSPRSSIVARLAYASILRAGRFLQRPDIFSPGNIRGQSVTKRFLIEPSLSYFIPSFF